ncbi:MAG: hypothetical protein C4527_26170 [Candidatus Omnitrophota bacterium]|jgi:hypothetical protein|nr:MAG: hypothetical protein C4527_26170 [Candidatus Omnitrophota bacterium]
MMNRFVIISCLILNCIGLAWAQEKIDAGQNQFDFLCWPGRGSLIDSATSAEYVRSRLLGAWHDAHLPIYLKQNLRIWFPQNDSLKWYKGMIEELHPACIEGDALYVKEEVNRRGERSNDICYIPLLRFRHEIREHDDSVRGEIIFSSRLSMWEGVLGVVHPSYSVGGNVQLNHWREQTGREADMVAFSSSFEALRHFFAGTIQAAAVPKGEVDHFLRECGQENLLSTLVRIEIPEQESPMVIFLREDLYHDPFTRTLISETWLRDHFFEYFESTPSIFP